MKRKKDDYIRVKSKYEKTKKDVENGFLYSDDNKADLSRNMLSTCICPGCPRKKKHKTKSSKECIWHNKLSHLKNKDMPGALKQFAMDFLPASVHDVAEVLFEKLCGRGGIPVSNDDTADLLETEHFLILSNANEINQIF
eukprot:4811591-Ditylum_brightwellii.AAC.1